MYYVLVKPYYKYNLLEISYVIINIASESHTLLGDFGVHTPPPVECIHSNGWLGCCMIQVSLSQYSFPERVPVNLNNIIMNYCLYNIQIALRTKMLSPVIILYIKL